MKKIPFNIPAVIGNEIQFIQDCINAHELSGDKSYTKKCVEFFSEKYNFHRSLLTTSCTDALELISLLANIKEGDEVILPSFTFVSTANAFALRGAKLVFADSTEFNPNICPDSIDKLITKKTKAIVVVHYAGMACQMNEIIRIAKENDIFLIEDAAQAIDSYYYDSPLGSIGDFSAFSFHETKNISCGEGGLCVINNESYYKRAEILREKGTNRSAFFRGEIDKYGWVDVGSSFLPSELNSSFLYGQLLNIDLIQKRRIEIWERYSNNLKTLLQYGVQLQNIPSYATNNAHMFYILCKNSSDRDLLIKYLKNFGISAAFHYQSLHESEYFKNNYDGEVLVNSIKYSEVLLRLPMYFSLSNDDVDYISEKIINYYKS